MPRPREEYPTDAAERQRRYRLRKEHGGRVPHVPLSGRQVAGIQQQYGLKPDCSNEAIADAISEIIDSAITLAVTHNKRAS